MYINLTKPNLKRIPNLTQTKTERSPVAKSSLSKKKANHELLMMFQIFLVRAQAICSSYLTNVEKKKANQPIQMFRADLLFTILVVGSKSEDGSSTEDEPASVCLACHPRCHLPLCRKKKFESATGKSTYSKCYGLHHPRRHPSPF